MAQMVDMYNSWSSLCCHELNSGTKTHGVVFITVCAWKLFQTFLKLCFIWSLLLFNNGNKPTLESFTNLSLIKTDVVWNHDHIWDVEVRLCYWICKAASFLLFLSWCPLYVPVHVLEMVSAKGTMSRNWIQLHTQSASPSLDETRFIWTFWTALLY